MPAVLNTAVLPAMGAVGRGVTCTVVVPIFRASFTSSSVGLKLSSTRYSAPAGSEASKPSWSALTL